MDMMQAPGAASWANRSIELSLALALTLLLFLAVLGVFVLTRKALRAKFLENVRGPRRARLLFPLVTFAVLIGISFVNHDYSGRITVGGFLITAGVALVLFPATYTAANAFAKKRWPTAWARMWENDRSMSKPVHLIGSSIVLALLIVLAVGSRYVGNQP